MTLNSQLIQRFKEILPKLHKDLHKGQSGRIGIVGGSKEYSGAPYFSAISSLRVGADLSYIFTTKEAAPVIKSYTPELIVLPLLECENNQSDLKSWISKVHSLIIGPGLGRSDAAFNSVKTAINIAKSQDIPLVIDADGLFLLANDISLVKGYKKCILTPNMMEFKRLYEKSFSEENEEYDEIKKVKSLEEQCEAVKKLAKRLDHVTIIKKGKIDIISDGRQVVYNDAEGSLKRCGGVGDLLTGTIGTFTYWCDSAKQIDLNKSELDENYLLNQPYILAAYSASAFIKECSKIAFEKFHRSVLAVDIIDQIGETFFQMFDKQN